MRIRKELENGNYEYEKIPDAYKSGRGYLFRNGKCGLKLYEITSEIENYDLQDFIQFKRLLKLCRLNYRGTQRLTYRSNSYGDAKDVGNDKIAQQLDITKPTVKKFLEWCFKRDYLRKDEKYGTLIVNPMKIGLGSRINGREYYTFRDLLDDKIPTKYKIKLTEEALNEEIQISNREEEFEE